MVHSPTDSVTQLKGVGAQLAAKLKKLGIVTLQDLLFHLPRQYTDRTRITPIGSLQPFQYVVVQGEVIGTNVIIGKRRSLLCRIQDDSGAINLRFYYFSNAQRTRLATGFTVRCYGEARRGASGLEIYHPEYQVIGAGTKTPVLEQTLTPIYPITDGVTQPRLRSLIKLALTYFKGYEFTSLIPQNHPQNTSLLEQLRYLHSPPKEANLQQLLEGTHPYQQALVIEELTAYQLSLLRLRKQRHKQSAIPLVVEKNKEQAFLQALYFTLTAAQQRVVAEIQHDLTRSVPMMRLLQGDVGAGKTVVAALAALQATANHRQVAIMAPTEILAEQHRRNFEQWFVPLGLTIGWLTGRQKLNERREQLKGLEEGHIHIVVGTHALFQEDVIFNDLALIIIDEQHRFGVHQRLSLRSKGMQRDGIDGEETYQDAVIPHQLIMTATPIPRTLAMSTYADLDYSVIDELPKGRIPVKTVIISQHKRQTVIERIDHACQSGRQAYWVCTLIEQSEMFEAQAAEETAAVLKELLPKLSIGLVHGRLKSQEKDEIMKSFKTGNIDLLVATTVIEVGVDVPNASLMIIENPERLGLAQLHQLRGRIGRGSVTSHCVLLYGDNLSLQSKERLKAMRTTNDGFKIAEIDLQLRGPGEVLGTRQTGDIDFTLADLRRDLSLMPTVKTHAETLLRENPEQTETLIARWLGNSEKYANA
ncbi:ATP-dependent DNA helicase RecG [Candidatus Endobugula sertula]|uniref:ATP-dependent DNA helicase RecG n=1 Tax=Candidatus Endobugula sertula TaxID=62101 RepID=A0A1D2QR91_9GAMM|nr:ATP-dependent DNA helicase RecG [Candidatus Endobugula sertula]